MLVRGTGPGRRQPGRRQPARPGRPAPPGPRRLTHWVGMLAGVISRDDIRATYDTIRPYIRRTPVVQLDLSDLDPAGTGHSTRPVVTFKLEQLQCAGSFKARGAFANLLLRDVPP